MSEPTPEAIEAAAEAIAGYCAADWPSQAYEGEAEAALLAAAPYLIREAQAQALEDAAEKLYETARAELQTADAYQWPMARRVGYTDGMINARHVLTARAAAIRDGAQ